MDKNKLEIIPGILEKEWSQIEEKLENIKTFAKSAHIDIIDGKFVDNTTYLEFDNFKKYSDDILLEAHLMVENPIQYLDSLSKNGFKRFIGHIEKMPNLAEFVAKGQLVGEVGLALDGPTEIEKIKELNLDDLDCVLIYASERVGFAGPPMMPERLEKIRQIRKKSDISIEVDGGVKDHTISMAKESGANRFVATSFIWNSKDPKEAYEKLLEVIESQK